MKIGIPKEIKAFENRVSLIPSYVKRLVDKGHKVFIQKGAGENSGLDDEQYLKVGVQVLSSMEEVYEQCDLIIKVKEPQEEEFALIREKQIVFSFFHFPSSRKLVEALLKTKCVAVCYETLEAENGTLPILAPMSAIAGKLAVQVGMRLLENINGGKGVLLGGIPGVSQGNVMILGAGIVGANACYVASHLRANVTLLDIDFQRLQKLHDTMPNNVSLLYSNEENILKTLRKADLVVSAVHLVGRKTPILIKKELLKEMEENSVIVDVSIDQGGCIETSRITTHVEPSYKVAGVIHYCVPNMPSIVSKTSSQILSHASFPFLEQIADLSIDKAITEVYEIRKALNLWEGNITNQSLANTFEMPCKSIDEILN